MHVRPGIVEFVGFGMARIRWLIQVQLPILFWYNPHILQVWFIRLYSKSEKSTPWQVSLGRVVGCSIAS